MASVNDDPNPRMSSGSGRSRDSRRANPQAQLSQIEKSVTHLLVATKQLLETLTHWSRGTATESEVSDVYVRLGYEFNIACRTFNAIGVETQDLGPVPDLLRTILEETLSQEASQSSLERYLPRIRDIVINLLHGLKAKQERLRQKNKRDRAAAGQNGGRQGSIDNTQAVLLDDIPTRQPSGRSSQRRPSTDVADNAPELPPPRTTSVGSAGRASPTRGNSYGRGAPNRETNSSQGTMSSSGDSTVSSSTMQNLPVITPYPEQEVMPSQPEPQANSYATDFPHPPPPPPKQQDAFAALQRGGELERRASRRFSQYQIHKQLGVGGAVPMLPPSQNTPIPNRGRDVRESMNAVRTRSSFLHTRQGSTRSAAASPSRKYDSTRVSEETGRGTVPAPVIKPPSEPITADSPIAKTPEDKLGPSFGDLDGPDPARISATLSGPLGDPILPPGIDREPPRPIPQRSNSRKVAPPSPPVLTQPFIPEQSPQPGKELTLFLQYKSKIKKFVLEDGYNDLTIGRLQLAFIEKFNWNTHSNGLDLPEIYLQDAASGVRHELEDLSDIKDRSVLVLNVEALDEVKKHIDDGIGGLRRVVEDMRSVMQDQQSALQRVSEKQQEAAKEIANIAAAPLSTRLPPTVVSTTPGPPLSPKDSAAQLSEVQSLRRDLAVVRQTYTSFVADINASMSNIRSKASSVKKKALDFSIPDLTGDEGRVYVNTGKKTLSDDSEKIVSRVDEVQDAVEDLRKDVVTRGVRPLARQLEQVAKDISIATTELKKMKEFLKREKPLWTKIWESELQVVCEERDLLTMQEELAADLEDDLEKAAQTFSLVEQATKQQNLQTEAQNKQRVPSGGLRPVVVNPQQAKEGMLNEVRALQPNHETRLEAIERAEKARQRELESRQGDDFQKELGSFVEEGKLQKTGGHEEVDRVRKAKDERIRKEVWERQNARERAKAERAAAAAAAAAAAPAAEEATDSTAPTEDANDAPIPETEVNGETAINDADETPDGNGKDGSVSASGRVDSITNVADEEEEGAKRERDSQRSSRSSWLGSIFGRGADTSAPA